MATCTITCLGCGNQVDIDWDQYYAAASTGVVRCHCGSDNLKVEQPPATSGEMIAALQGLQFACPSCSGRPVPGICAGCGGTGRRRL